MGRGLCIVRTRFEIGVLTANWVLKLTSHIAVKVIHLNYFEYFIIGDKKCGGMYFQIYSSRYNFLVKWLNVQFFVNNYRLGLVE